MTTSVQEMRAEVAGIIGVPADTPWPAVRNIVEQLMKDSRRHGEEIRRRHYGSTQRVFRRDDPEPPDIQAVIDRESDVWHRDSAGWNHDGWSAPWVDVLDRYGPLMECPDYEAALVADEQLRATR